MAKDIAEEYEILMALRLSGEISSQDNQKLETFFQSNQSVKQAFERKEKAFKLLTQAVKSSPKLQLSNEKRQALLHLSNSKKSGKVILTTYVVAAVAFFSFMIGMYFYANKVLETPQKTLVLKENVASNKDTIKSESANDPATGNELKNEASPVVQPNLEKAIKVASEKQSLKEATREESGFAKAEKGTEKSTEIKNIMHEEPLAKKDAAPGKKNEAVKNGSDKKEANYSQGVGKPEASAPVIVPLKEAKRKEPAKGELIDDETDAISDNKAMSKTKNHQPIEKSKNAEKLDEIKSLGTDKNDTEEHAKLKGDGVALAATAPDATATKATYEYVANFKFNQKEFSKKIISSRDLSIAAKSQKLSLQEIVELTGLKAPLEQQKLRSKLDLSEKITIQDIAQEMLDSKRAEAKPKSESIKESLKKEKEGKTEQTSAFADELALICQCLLSYNDRAKLPKDAEKTLLENIKKTLKSLSHLEPDDLLKQWLEKIDKEI